MDDNFNAECIKTHNELRLLHKSLPLKFSKQLAIDAQDWAYWIARRKDLQRGRPNKTYGENVAFCKDLKPGEEVTLQWYQQVVDYKFSQERQDVSKVGFFSQLVWCETIEAGFGRAQSEDGDWYSVGRYRTPANILGKYPQNVNPPVPNWLTNPLIKKLINMTKNTISLDVWSNIPVQTDEAVIDWTQKRFDETETPNVNHHKQASIDRAKSEDSISSDNCRSLLTSPDMTSKNQESKSNPQNFSRYDKSQTYQNYLKSQERETSSFDSNSGTSTPKFSDYQDSGLSHVTINEFSAKPMRKGFNYQDGTYSPRNFDDSKSKTLPMKSSDSHEGLYSPRTTNTMSPYSHKGFGSRDRLLSPSYMYNSEPNSGKYDDSKSGLFSPKSGLCSPQNIYDPDLNGDIKKDDVSTKPKPVHSLSKKSKLELNHQESDESNIYQDVPDSVSSLQTPEDLVNVSALCSQLLTCQNSFRKKHGVKELTLNKVLSVQAQEWANYLNKHQHLDYSNYKFMGKEIGENIAIKILTNVKFLPERLIGNWYKEETNYHYDTEPNRIDAFGHFTQIIWASSTEFGAGISTSVSGQLFIVCFYYPAGNVKGEFTKNVLPLLK